MLLVQVAYSSIVKDLLVNEARSKFLQVFLNRKRNDINGFQGVGTLFNYKSIKTKYLRYQDKPYALSENVRTNLRNAR